MEDLDAVLSELGLSPAEEAKLAEEKAEKKRKKKEKKKAAEVKHTMHGCVVNRPPCMC